MPNLKYKTCLDLANGFWSVPLEKLSQLKTSFTFKGKSYCWTRLPQGYHNSPNAFQTVVEDVLEGEPVVIYIDDIYLTTDTEEEHLESLERVIRKRPKAGLKIGGGKCEIGPSRVKYLGFQITEMGTDVLPGYLEKTFEERTTTVKQMESLLGRCEYVAGHIPGYSEHASPLHRAKGRIRKKQPDGRVLQDSPLTEEELKTLEILKTHCLTEVRPLMARKMGSPIRVETIITEKGGTCVVYNHSEGTKQEKDPCYYHSMTFSNTEQQYAPEEKELCLHYRFYPQLINLGNPLYVLFVTTHPHIQQASKDQTAGAKAQTSRYGKWHIMTTDHRVKYVLNTSKAKPVRPPKPPEDWKPEVYIYTDGSRVTEEEFAKWAFVATTPGGAVIAKKSGYTEGTAQTAEVTALVEALAWMDTKKKKKAHIWSDSAYVVNSYSDNLSHWVVREWQNHRGKELTHTSLWKTIEELRKRKSIRLIHVPAHTAEKTQECVGNRTADELAQDRSDYPRQAKAVIGNMMLMHPKGWLKQGKIVIRDDEAFNQLRAMHCALGHVGFKRTEKWLLKSHIKVPNMRTIFKRMKSRCEQCANKGGAKRPHCPPEPIECSVRAKSTPRMLRAHFLAQRWATNTFWSSLTMAVRMPGCAL